MRIAAISLLVLIGALLSSCDYFESDQAKLEKARHFYNDNKFNQSIILTKKILQSDSKNCPARVLLGQDQFAKFSLLGAVETMRMAKQLGCKEDAVFAVALKSLMYQNKLTAARELLEDPVFAQAGNSAQGLLLKGDVYFLQGDAKIANKYYSEHYARTHDQAEHCLSQAKLLSLKRNFQRVIEQTSECEKLKPTADANIFYAQVRYVRALAQLNGGKADEGMETLKTILDSNSDPKDPNLKIQSALMLMKLYVSQKKVDDASQLADILLRYVAVPDIYHVKGLKAEQAKRNDLAEQQFLAALKLNPNYLPSLLEMARLKYREGNIEQAKYYTGRVDAVSGKNSLTEQLDELLAVKYLQAGDLDSIINSLANGKNSQNLKSRYILALAYARKGERDQAWQIFREVQNSIDDPVKKDLLEARLELAMDDMKRAEALFRKHADTGNELAIIGLAQMYLGQKRYPEAEELLHNVLAQGKNKYNATMLLVDLYSKTHRRQEAFSLLDSQLKTQQNKPAYQLLLAKLHYRYGEYQDAVAICKELQKANPDDIEPYIVMANAYLRLAQFDQAKNTYEFVVKKQPGNINAYLMLAYLANKAGKNNEAMEYVDQALTSDPLDLKSIYAKVELLLAQHEQKAAIDFAGEKADALKNTQAGALLLAFVYEKTGDAHKAYRNYRRALENGARDIRTALRAYHSSVSVNGADRAQIELDDFLRTNPAAGNLIHAANYFMGRGEYTLAEKYYRAYIKLNQKNPAAYNNLAWLTLKHGDPKSALDYAHQALALAPDSPAVQDTLGQVLLATGDIDKAGEYLKAAYAKLGNDPSVKYHLAVYYYHINQPEESKQLLHTITDSKFPEQAEARDLLEKLTKKQH